MAMFIRVDIDQQVVKKTPGLAKKLVEVCPVKIFALGKDESTAAVVEENLDECTLCDLCMQASPEGVKVVKLYES
jgi:NAD-dependent dihydropyrimidine dehydrogenase PreA subunit